MKLLQIDFAYSGPFGARMVETLGRLDGDTAGSSSPRWKVWTENAATHQAGGIYAFDDERSLQSYFEAHTLRLHRFGVRDIRARIYDITDELSRITHAPFA